MEASFAWIKGIARGAALMTKTNIDTHCHEIIVNAPLTEAINANLRAFGAPVFTPEEHTFTRRLQQTFVSETENTFKAALNESIELSSAITPKGSTDVGEASWKVPVGGLRTTCFAAGSPGQIAGRTSPAPARRLERKG